ncbi:cyclic pyranopterin monophosphate synthase subunit MoaA [Geoalkalibacter ferrihydriticus]|uniref:GTP 3',8-cyclase n=2 Tax=Geoalkalibacter ferrihydriticus TaxID=392333 RepID=A0A0C2DVN1_9BACT|nr:GTP 3',8-cyclase MoaA [Geoalkalibacter ferrihydriticus]KIH77504.1 pyranopterin triphosphate synthase [Geoalkalibacter ferrihydriticus DSM 17813]SDL64894.1 cyclic pyranopterin monophosphate synthase subunit MoaA [Geoalkalibacter ferrihydriticus]
MRDNFGRVVDYLRLSVTDRCNLRCRYCMPAQGVDSLGHGQILSYEELLRVAAAAAAIGVRKIRVTGGEPLVRKGLVEFIGRLAALPQRPEITLTTNGMLLAQYAAPLKQAGLSRVNVSLDTLRSERFAQLTRRSGFEQVLAGLTAAEQVGLAPLKINMVPIAGVNADEVADFARLTLEHPWEIRFIEFMPVSGDLDFPPESRFPADDIIAAFSSVAPVKVIPRQGSGGVARLFRFAGASGRLGVIPAVSHHFCHECNRLRVTADGRVRPCLFSDDELDLRTLLRSGVGDEELHRFLRHAISAKPEKHHIGEEDFRPGARPMQGIGG